MTNKEMMLAALKDSGHFIDRENNVVYVSPKFNHEAEKFDTDECKTLDAVMKRFPQMTIREYVPKRKARLTFQAMEVFICQMPNAEKNYDEFMRLRKTAPASHRNPYKAVCDWFEKKYPYYGKSIVYNDEGKQVWNIVEASRCRMDAAIRILQEKPNMLLREVAACVGYEGSSYFSKVFHQYTGKTPSQYFSSEEE